MLQSFVGANWDLCGESFADREDRCADRGRKAGVQNDLPANHDERAVRLGISPRLVDAIEFSAVQGKPRQSSLFSGGLIPQRIFRFAIELFFFKQKTAYEI